MVFPLFVELYDPQIEDLIYCHIIGKGTFLCYFPEAGIDTFDGIGRVHDLAHGTTVVKELLYMLEIVFPHGYSTGISRPFFLQLGERLPGCLCIY